MTMPFKVLVKRGHVDLVKLWEKASSDGCHNMASTNDAIEFHFWKRAAARDFVVYCATRLILADFQYPEMNESEAAVTRDTL
jgi:hypothetical protein